MGVRNETSTYHSPFEKGVENKGNHEKSIDTEGRKQVLTTHLYPPTLVPTDEGEVKGEVRGRNKEREEPTSQSLVYTRCGVIERQNLGRAQVRPRSLSSLCGTRF